MNCIVSSSKPRRGFALIAALWLLVAISALSLEISLASRTRRLASANVLEEARARAAAESGVEHARAILARMLEEGGGRRAWRDPLAILDPWSRLDGLKLDSVAMGEGEWYRVSLADLGARLNVNRASENEIRRYLVAHRIDAAVADGIAQAIADWRDPDDLRRAQGAEREFYRRAGAEELPSNMPFADVNELRHVAGMTTELLEQLRGELTVIGEGQVNVNAAGRPVLLSLPGMTEAAAEVILRAQQSHTHIATFQELMDLFPLPARESVEREIALLLPRIAFETREVGVVSAGHVEGSPVRVVANAVLARGGSSAFVAWRYLSMSAEEKYRR
jgi:general secretion pathway protein K